MHGWPEMIVLTTRSREDNTPFWMLQNERGRWKGGKACAASLSLSSRCENLVLQCRQRTRSSSSNQDANYAPVTNYVSRLLVMHKLGVKNRKKTRCSFLFKSIVWLNSYFPSLNSKTARATERLFGGRTAGSVKDGLAGVTTKCSSCIEGVDDIWVFAEFTDESLLRAKDTGNDVISCE